MIEREECYPVMLQAAFSAERPLNVMLSTIIHPLVNPSRPNPGTKGKSNLNFYFHTSL